MNDAEFIEITEAAAHLARTAGLSGDQLVMYDELIRLCALARKGRALEAYAVACRAVIEQHNAGCQAVCDENRKRGHCADYLNRGRANCPNCPLEDKLELPPQSGHEIGTDQRGSAKAAGAPGAESTATPTICHHPRATSDGQCFSCGMPVSDANPVHAVGQLNVALSIVAGIKREGGPFDANDYARGHDTALRKVERLLREAQTIPSQVPKQADWKVALDRDEQRLIEDAVRYRYLRDDDHWGEDAGPDFHGSAWGVLGEKSGREFDEFIDARMQSESAQSTKQEADRG